MEQPNTQTPQNNPPSNPAQVNELLSQDPNMMQKKESPQQADSHSSQSQTQPQPSQTQGSAPQPSQSSPAGTTTPPPTKKIVKGKKLGAGFFLGCFGLFAFLFIIFIILLVFSLKGNSTVSFIPGVSVSDMKSVLSVLVNGAFGILSLVLLIAIVATLFKRIIAKKEEKEKRKKSLFNIIIAGGVLIFNIVLWIVALNSIDSIQVVQDETLQGDILVYNVETNDLLKSTTGLTSPVELRFDASNVSKRVKTDMKILSYEWDLNGDGKFGDASGEVVTWNYQDKGEKNGIYEVKMKLTVRSADDKKQEQEFPLDVTIAYVKPKIVLEVDKTSGEAPLEVNFDASKSVDVDGQDQKALTYEWDFNDDGKFDDGTESIMKHTFDTIGKFPVTLRVIDRDKKFSLQKTIIDVTDIKKDTPIAKITSSSLTGEVPLKVMFSAEDSTSPNGKIVKYEWNFGDASLPEKSMTTAHTFDKKGTYTVQLTVTDEKDKKGTASMSIEAGGGSRAPQIKIISTPAYHETSGKNIIEGDVPLQVTFDASSSVDEDKDIVEYKWDLDGDGVFETLGAKPDPYTFYKEGENKVKAKVIDSKGNESVFDMIVNVKYKPFEAVIEASPTSGAAPLTVSFDGSASRYNNGKIEQYQWDFNDGNPPKMYSAKIQYTFQNIGTYNVKLTVFSNDGKQASTTKTIYVTEVPLNARFTTNVKSGRSPLNVVFDPNDSTGVIARYLWDFGDGVMSSERKPTHVFTKAGTYTIVLTVYAKDNVTSQFSEQIIVEE